MGFQAVLLSFTLSTNAPERISKSPRHFQHPQPPPLGLHSSQKFAQKFAPGVKPPPFHLSAGQIYTGVCVDHGGRWWGPAAGPRRGGGRGRVLLPALGAPEGVVDPPERYKLFVGTLGWGVTGNRNPERPLNPGGGGFRKAFLL